MDVRSRFCLILEPQEGYLVGCRIHLTVAAPHNWPCVPLTAKIDTSFEHVTFFDSNRFDWVLTPETAEHF